MKKAIFCLLMILCVAIALPAAALDYTFISDLSQHKNKHLNILMPNAEGYKLEGDEDSYSEYSLTLIDPAQNRTDVLPSEALMYFRHPMGVDPDNLDYYSFTITHTTDEFSKTYSTADGTITAYEQYGLCIKTNRLGDFEITYEVADNIGPAWDDLMQRLEITAPNESFELEGIRVSRNDNTITFQGLGTESRRIRSDAELDADLYTLPGNHFVFERVELQEVRILPKKEDNWTVHFTDSVAIRRGVEVWMKGSGSRVHLINDTEIRDLNEHLSQRDFPLIVDVPEGASFLLTGKGSIPVDYCCWFTGTLEEVYNEQKSTLINVFVRADSTEEAVPQFAKVFSDIKLDHKQFPSKDLSSCIRTCLVNETPDGDSYEVVYKDHPAARNLSELNADQVNLLLPGTHDDADLTLKVAIHEQNGDQAIAYDLALIDSKTQMVAGIAAGADLYLPYPAGMNMESATQYDFTIMHYTAYGVENFSTRDGSIILTPYGLRIRIHSMSPFLLAWEDMPNVSTDTLPQTGDNSHIALWLVLLTLAGTAILILKRKTA